MPKFVILLFLIVSVTQVAFSSPLSWFEKTLADNSDTLRCDNNAHWQDVVNKVKKEHPSTDHSEMVKLISHQIMNDSTIRQHGFLPIHAWKETVSTYCRKPIMAAARYIINDGKYGNNSRTIIYTEYDASIYDSTFSKPQKFICELSDGLTVGVMYRDPYLVLTDIANGIQNPTELTHTHGMQVFLKQFTRDDRFVISMHALAMRSLMLSNNFTSNLSCSKLPEIQAITSKLDKMKITSVAEYTRLFADKIKDNINPQMYSIYYGSISKDRFSYSSGGDGRGKDVNSNCQPNDPACYQCQARKKMFGIVFVHYYKK